MKLTTIVCAIAVGAVAAAPVYACSICRCGDPTFNALGKDGVSQSGLRLAPADEGDPDTLGERLVSAAAAVRAQIVSKPQSCAWAIRS